MKNNQIKEIMKIFNEKIMENKDFIKTIAIKKNPDVEKFLQGQIDMLEVVREQVRKRLKSYGP